MYLLGNAQQLAANSPMWRSIVDELSEQGRLGSGLQIACARHGEVEIVNKPGRLPAISPDGGYHIKDTELIPGGCTRPCEESISKCGHPCPKKVS
jgi:hypothetical protein